MDMSADTLAAAAAGSGSFRGSSSGTAAAAAAAAAGGFHRYGLEHPSAADGAEEVEEEDAGQQQPGSKQVGASAFLNILYIVGDGIQQCTCLFFRQHAICAVGC
jgi:hypothetical protein